MNSSSTVVRRSFGFSILACWLALTTACSESRNVSVDQYELPEVEPTAADHADRDAINHFRSHVIDNASSTSPGQWPQLFGPARNGVAADQPVDLAWDTDGPKESWSIDIGTGYGSPVVSDNRVVFNHRIDDEEIVQCVDANDGSTLWEHRYPTDFECDVEYSNGPYSTPLIVGDLVYAVGGQGQLFCLRLDSGDVVWHRNLHQEYELEDGLFPVGATPVVNDGRLIFNLGATEKEAGIIALDASTGSDLWQATDFPAGYCSPFFATIHDRSFVFVYTNIALVSLDPATGAVDWSLDHYGRAPMSYNAVSPLVVDDKVLIVTGPGPGAVCVKVLADRSYEEQWRNRRVLDSQYNTLLTSGDNVIGFTAAGQGGAELRCVNLSSGELQWKHHSVLRRGQGLTVNGALVMLGERGHLAAMLPTDSGPKVLGFTEDPIMSDPCYCAPALASSKLYLKDEKRLACFDLSVDPTVQTGSRTK